MALVSTQEVALAISATAEDGGSVKRLSEQLAAAAAHAGEAAPQLQALAGEVSALEASQGAVQTLIALKRETAALGRDMDTAQGQIDGLAQRLDETRTAAAAAAQAQTEAAARLATARTRYDEIKTAVAAASTELAETRARFREGGTAAQEYGQQLDAARTQLASLRADLKTARAGVVELGAEHRAAGKASREAAGDERALTKEYAEAVASTRKLSAELGNKRSALAATEQALQAAGVNTRALATEQKRLATEMGEVEQRAAKLIAAHQQTGSAAQAAGKQTAAGLADSTSASERLGASLSKVTAALAGVFAVGQVKAFAGDAIAVADAYGQMASRIEMATGSAEEYDLVQRRLLESAGATYRPLAEAQELFIRTADALRSMGYATEQALDINDSFSSLLVANAASADKAAGAIDAYSKAIQSGKVESDAWQTIMAAMPTVVDAIAQATGRSTEEIRKLGVTGKLAVTELNEGLRQTVEANKAVAASMPTTVADALTNLSTAWSAYIGEANRASGTTERLVELIELVGGNLDTVVGVATKAGEVLTAAFAMRAYTALTGFMTTALASAKAVDAVGAATARQGAAAAAAAPQIGAAAAATTAHGQAATAATGALAGHTAAAGLTARALGALGSSLRMLGWLAVVDQVGSVIDAYARLRAARAELAKAEESEEDTARRLAERYRELSERTGVAITSTEAFNAAVADGTLSYSEAEGQWIAAGQALREVGVSAEFAAAAMQSANAGVLVEQFREIIEKGKSAKDALKELADATDFADPNAVLAFNQALRDLGDSGEVSAAQVAGAWESALSRLSAGQIGAFSLNLREAFDAGRLSAQEFARINEQVLAASFEKLGLNATDALGRISPAAQEAIDSIDNIVEGLQIAEVEASRAATAIEAAFLKAIKAADSAEALELLVEKAKALNAAGVLAAGGLERIVDAADEAEGALSDIMPGIQNVEEAFRRLGIKSDEELRKTASAAREAFDVIRNSGTASVREVAEAFVEYADAAIAANNGVATESLKVEAAIAGVEITTDKAGKTIVRTMAEAAAETAKVGNEAEDSAKKMGEVGEAAEESADKATAAAQRTASISTEMIQAMEMLGERTITTLAQQVERANQISEIVAGMAEAATRALDALANQQARLNSSAGRGVEDLQLRLLELNGTEEEIARARLERDKAQVRRQQALLKLDIERAELNGDHAEADRLREEIRLLGKQLTLLDQIHAEEEKQRKAREREEKRTRGSSSDSDSSSGGGSAPAPTTPTAPQPPTRTEVHRVEINIGGRRAAITTNSRTEAASVAAVLQELEEAAFRS